MAGKEAVAERRFVVSLQSFGLAVWIAGQIDHYDPQTGVLTDLKTINSNGRRLFKMDLPQPHHQAQLWLYAWLLEQSGWGYPRAAQILYVDMGQGILQMLEQMRLEKAEVVVKAGP